MLCNNTKEKCGWLLQLTASRISAYYKWCAEQDSNLRPTG